jgi:C4-dicarboxylate-specific signal transduction histidine kinase
VPIDFARLTDLLQLAPEVAGNGTTDSDPKILTLGSRLLGYTVHPISPRLVVVLLRDITERKRLEGIAEAANLMENIGYVFAGIRHELGNPVNSLKVTLSVLRRKLGSLGPEAVAEYTERSMAEIARIEYLLAGLRSFSMYESVRSAPLSLGPYLERFLGMANKDLAARGVRTVLDVPDEELWILADERALQQVLLNLLTNSLDALAGGESPTLHIIARPRETLTELTFRDNGSGMAPKALADAFKPFHTTKANGTGLGLVIVRKMLSAMGGHVVLSSRLGVGTEATITLARLGTPPSPDDPRNGTS